MSIAAIQGMAGPVSVQGEATVDLEKERPVIDAQRSDRRDRHRPIPSGVVARADGAVPDPAGPCGGGPAVVGRSVPAGLDAQPRWAAGADIPRHRLWRSAADRYRRACPAGEWRTHGRTARRRLLRWSGGIFRQAVRSGRRRSGLAAKLSLVDAKLSDFSGPSRPRSICRKASSTSTSMSLPKVRSQAEMIGSLGGTGTVRMRDGAVAGFDIDRVASRLDRADTQKELNELADQVDGGRPDPDRPAGRSAPDRQGRGPYRRSESDDAQRRCDRDKAPPIWRTGTSIWRSASG